MSHVDGDSFLSLSTVAGAQGKLSAEVCFREIFSRYRLPQSVSFIGAELEGSIPKLRPRLKKAQQIARQILALPWVEPAVHTYSHPFDWAGLEAQPDAVGRKTTTHGAGIYPLAVEGYHRFDPYREIVYAARIVDRFTPPGKTTRLIFWSGDTDPGPGTLQLAYAHGFLNINGEPTTIRNRFPVLAFVRGHGVWKRGLFQVYPAFGNDNDFTESWSRRYGYRSVISSFRLTEKDGKRLKPLNIYYHFYSCELDAALKNLHEIYRTALSWNPHPIFTSTFIEMALAFEKLALALRLDGGVEITGYGPATTLRLPPELGYPDLDRSRNVVGFRDTPFGRYVHLVRGERAVLCLQDTAPSKRPYLIEANAQVVRVQGGVWHLEAEGIPVEVVLFKPTGCQIQTSPQARRTIKKASRHLQLIFPDAHAAISWSCRPED